VSGQNASAVDGFAKDLLRFLTPAAQPRDGARKERKMELFNAPQFRIVDLVIDRTE
jgi:hypothetical protein